VRISALSSFLTNICIFFLEKNHKKLWSSEAVKDLISLWGKYYTKAREESQRKGMKSITLSDDKYEDISKTICKRGHGKFNEKQCRKKIAKLIINHRRVCYCHFIV